MKILVVWYDYFHYLFGITSALNKNDGVQAKSFSLEYFNRQAGLLENLITKTGVQYFKKKYYEETRAQLIETIKTYEPGAVLFLNADYEFIVDNEVFKTIKDQNAKSLVWFVDGIKNMHIQQGYLKNFDKIYSFECDDIGYIKEQYGIENPEYIPLGLCQDVYKPRENKIFEYDVCFVGSNDKKRLQILEYVAKYCIENNRKMVVYGHMWRHRPFFHRIRQEGIFKKKYPNLYKVVINKYLKPEQVAEVYRQSRICLNIVQKAHGSANPRTFEIMGTSSFQIVDYNQGIADMFEDGKHLAMYKSKEELKDKLDYYLKHDEEREQVALNGYKLALEQYTIERLLYKIIIDKYKS